MRQDIADLWADKMIELGEDRQLNSCLKAMEWRSELASEVPCYCALGVLMQLYIDHVDPNPAFVRGSNFSGVGAPPEVMAWSGLQDSAGTFPRSAVDKALGQTSIMALNDYSAMPFSYIAKFVRKHWESL